jgi:alkanesulfonate monooxygenase SsuD/methylene tetrahydromethanopterin reductase-like flavin-dependent oxidoreductase (luciferase family)
MQFGFNLPNSGALATPEIMARIAREGEALGYDYLTVTDHVVLPDMAEPGYPYSESGAFYSTDSAHRHEMLTLAAWLAAITNRVRGAPAPLSIHSGRQPRGAGDGRARRLCRGRDPDRGR